MHSPDQSTTPDADVARPADQSRTPSDVRDALLAALDERRWAHAVSIIGTHWSLLMDSHSPDDLDHALRVIPLSAFESDVRAAAVRDIRLHSSADAVERVLGDPSLPDADDLSRLHSIARSDRALSLLSVASSRMIALRVRGRMTRAIQLALLVERLGHIAVVHQPGIVAARLPAALLQVGITRGLAGDIDGAVISLQDAYERGPTARARYVEADAAGKLAFFHALAGRITEARRWIRRYDEAPDVDGWYRPRLDLTADVARSLVAIESLDREAAERALAMLEQPVNAEQSWGPSVTYVHARYALAWGDRLGAIRRIRHDTTRYRGWLGEGTALGPMLLAAEVDLLLSTEKVARAQAVLDARPEHDEHEAVRLARARIALHRGRWVNAARIASGVVSELGSARFHAEALASAAVADQRRGETHAAASSLAHLDDALRSTGLALPGLAVPASERAALTALPAGHGARDPFHYHDQRIQLTPQQHLVLEGLAKGASTREIAEHAHLSLNTVKTHSKALFKRLGASSRDEALARAHDAGLI